METYTVYPASHPAKAPLLKFLLEGLRQADCIVPFASQPDHEPFLITFETPLGERLGVLCYAFLANSRDTRNRPADEHRFQVKLGSSIFGSQ